MKNKVDAMNRKSDEIAAIALTKAFCEFTDAVGRYPDPDAHGWEGLLGIGLAQMREAKTNMKVIGRGKTKGN